MASFYLSPLKNSFARSPLLSGSSHSSASERLTQRAKLFNEQDLKDAVNVKLQNNKRRNINPQYELKEAAKNLGEAKESGYVVGLFSALNQITEKIVKISKQLSTAEEGSELKDKLEKQYKAVVEDYTEIITSSDFQKLKKINKQVIDSLKGGADPESIFKALAPEASFLGADYLNRVRSGDINQLTQFADSINTLGVLTKGDFSNSEEAAGIIDNALKSAAKALAGPTVTRNEVIKDEKKQAANTKEPPKLAQLSFGDSEGLALEIKTYIGSDAIQAALAHVPLDPSNVLHLAIKPDHDGKESKEYKEHENRKQIEKLTHSNVQRDDVPSTSENHSPSQNE